MAKGISIWVGGALSVALMVLALWAWRFAPELAAEHAASPHSAKLAIRSLAVGIGAAAQGLLLTLVIGRLYARHAIDHVLRLAAGLAALAAAVIAAVFAMGAR